MPDKFKAGDKVYFPKRNNKIYTLEVARYGGRDDLLTINFPNGGNVLFSNKGIRYLTNTNLPQIFHATKENKELLDKLYGISLEAPELSPEEKLRKHFSNPDAKPVVCWVSDSHPVGIFSRIALIKGLGKGINVDGKFKAHGGIHWRHAIPYYDLETAKPPPFVSSLNMPF